MATTKKTTSKHKPSTAPAAEPVTATVAAEPQPAPAPEPEPEPVHPRDDPRLKQRARFQLRSTSYMQQAGEPRPRIIKAAPDRPVTVTLYSHILRKDKKTGQEYVVPQPVSPARPNLFPINEAPAKVADVHVPPQPMGRPQPSHVKDNPTD